MTSILNAYPYPWGRPEAVRLQKELTVAFPEVEGARNLAAAAGLNQYALNINQSPDAFWRDVLNTAAELGLTHKLAQQAQSRLPTTAALHERLTRLLAEEAPVDTGTAPRPRRSDPRLRLAGILDHNRVVGGRSRELAKLDEFLAASSPQHLVLTGGAGMGKTALLAEWVRRLDARPDVDVVYYFISRQQGTAAYLDLLSTLLAQAVALTHGDPPPAGTDRIELETRWLEELQPGSSWLRQRPMVVVIDGVDEAEAAGQPLPRLLLPTSLADDVHLVVSARTMAGRDWSRELGLDGARVLPVGGLDESDIADLLAVAAVPAWVRGPESLAVLTQRTGGDPFYLRFLIDALTGQARKKITTPAGLAATPDGLVAYLTEIWRDAGGTVRDSARKATLGYLCVTLVPISAEELADIDPADPLTVDVIGDVLDEIGRVVVLDPVSRGIALAHWRLQDIVAKALLSRPERAAYQAALITWCDHWREHPFPYPYAVTQVVAHRMKTASGPDDLATAAHLLAEEDYQKLRVEELDDTAGLLGDLDRLLHAVADQAPNASTLLQLALAVGDIRTRWLRPEHVFELAADGDADAAARKLALLGSPAWLPWQQGASLVLAWALAGPNPDAARELLDTTVQQPGNSLTPLLAGRVRHALGNGPESELRMWFPPYELGPSNRDEAIAALERISGQPVTHGEGLRDPSIYTRGNETGAYLAEEDVPWLAAYARDQPGEGDKWLTSYLELQAGNPYVMYRNRALWSALAAVCCLPDPEQALRHAVHATRAALAPSAVRFTELARLAAVASVGGADEVRPVRTAATRAAAAVAGLGELGDQWGHHVRRLTAHAEIAAVVLHDRAAAEALLDEAMVVPSGYAGYRAPAYLAMAETFGILGDPNGRYAALDQALQSAHNIQEPAFCALMTARVNTLTEWWDGPHSDLPQLVDEFTADPDGARFAPRYRIGDALRYRDHSDHIPIDEVTHARDAQDLALALDISSARLLELNPEPDPTTMALPDPEFAPMIAAWLSARIAAADLPPPERIRLTAHLVPIAAADPTALDLVLGRWICALGSGFAELPALLAPLSRRSTVEPAGGSQAGVA